MTNKEWQTGNTNKEQQTNKVFFNSTASWLNPPTPIFEILVAFDKYEGPGLDGDEGSRIISTFLSTREFIRGLTPHRPTLFPLTAADAITVHKSQEINGGQGCGQLNRERLWTYTSLHGGRSSSWRVSCLKRASILLRSGTRKAILRWGLRTMNTVTSSFLGFDLIA